MERCNVNNSRIYSESTYMSFLKPTDYAFEAILTPSDCHEVEIQNIERAILNRYHFELHHTKKIDWRPYTLLLPIHLRIGSNLDLVQ